MALNLSSIKRAAFIASTAIPLLFSSNFAAAQDQKPVSVAAATSVPAPAQRPGGQVASLSNNCDDIKDVFKLARFNGEFKSRADSFVDRSCAGDVPLPKKGDAYNIKRWNGAAFMLSANGIELN